MTMRDLSFAELVALYLQEQVRCHGSTASATAGAYQREIEARLGIELESTEHCVQVAKTRGLLSEAEYREVATALRIHGITKKALDRIRDE